MYKKPIYVMRTDTCVAVDQIVPYGDRVYPSSEAKREEIALKLLGVYEEIDEDDEDTED